jgi:hypothetical protein
VLAQYQRLPVHQEQDYSKVGDMKNKIQMVDDDQVENVGIMSGFMDDLEGLLEELSAEEMEGMEEGDEADMARTMKRSPDSPEILMNNLRGDMRSIDARREELSDLVGFREAEETPEGVLALLQPILGQQAAPMPPQGMPAMPPQGMPPMPPQGMPPMPPQGMPGNPQQLAAGGPVGYADGGSTLSCLLGNEKLKRLRKPEQTPQNISKLKPEQRHRLWQAFLGEKLKRLRKPEPHRRQNISKLKP